MKKKTLNLKYTLLWLASGIIMLALAAFPQILGWFAALVGIYEPTNALFATMVKAPKVREASALFSGSYLSYNGREPDRRRIA